MRSIAGLPERMDEARESGLPRDLQVEYDLASNCAHINGNNTDFITFYKAPVKAKS